MFSGLIAHLGTVAALETLAGGGASLTVTSPSAIAEGVAPKDSIAVNGVCLTVVSHDARSVRFDVVPETLERSALGSLAPGSPVNLELSLRLGDRLGGHLVYGHVDGTARIVSKEREGQGHRIAFDLPDALVPYVVQKGYLAIDGISLTIASVANGRFEVALIPETSARTTLGPKGVGDVVNLEIDPIARYALAAATAYRTTSTTTDEIAWAYEI